jgi:hypothetical protein
LKAVTKAIAATSSTHDTMFGNRSTLRTTIIDWHGNRKHDGGQLKSPPTEAEFMTDGENILIGFEDLGSIANSDDASFQPAG